MHGVGMVERLVGALRRHGAAGFARLVVRNGAYYLGRIGGRHREEDKPDQWDTDHGVETSRVREIGSLRIASNNARFAVRYQPTDSDVLEAVLSRAAPVAEGRVFVDLGCGKGRVLLAASMLPFTRIVGVEFSPELAARARENVARFSDAAQMCRSVEIVEGDASGFVFPDSPLVLYLYNPFGPPVLDAVMANLASSLGKNPRPVQVIYVEPRHRACIERTGLLRVDEANERFAIYSSDGGGGP